ncbi:MAG: MaoC family dehydratase N-terminal domain-containing protein, partial [Clostridia bacterium]|nr:MaoC family dehydratase N-terminal domain-containing protein [Clostridia bacterium]
LEQDLIGDELIAGVSTKIEWKKPVYAGDVLEAEAEVTALTVRSERNGLVEICMRIWNQDGVEVMRNVTEAVVKRRGPANT